jgi:hypothetical protein
MGQPNRNIVLTLKKLSSKDNFYQDNKDWHLLRKLTRTTNNTPLNRLQHPYYSSYSQKKTSQSPEKQTPRSSFKCIQHGPKKINSKQQPSTYLFPCIVLSYITSILAQKAAQHDHFKNKKPRKKKTRTNMKKDL